MKISPTVWDLGIFLVVIMSFFSPAPCFFSWLLPRRLLLINVVRYDRAVISTRNFSRILTLLFGARWYVYEDIKIFRANWRIKTSRTETHVELEFHSVSQTDGRVLLSLKTFFYPNISILCSTIWYRVTLTTLFDWMLHCLSTCNTRWIRWDSKYYVFLYQSTNAWISFLDQLYQTLI